MKSRLLAALSACISIFLSTATPAALVDNGGGLIYDTVLNITWSQPEALRPWHDANTWAAGLTLGGVSGWRLPYISVTVGAGPLTSSPIDCRTATELECRDNELGYMDYQNLEIVRVGGLLSGHPDLALFPNLVNYGENQDYWNGTAKEPNFAWLYFFGAGGSGNGFIYDSNYSWAVHAGNVGAIPIPPALWLFGTGLLGLVGVARRRAA